MFLSYKDGGELEEEGKLVTARPRRISELNMPNQTPPIPNASSFFIFSPTNRWLVIRYPCLIVIVLARCYLDEWFTFPSFFIQFMYHLYCTSDVLDIVQNYPISKFSTMRLQGTFKCPMLAARFVRRSIVS